MSELAPVRSDPDVGDRSRIHAELIRRSAGNVLAIPPDGPVLRRPAQHRRARPDTFRPVLGGRDRLLVATATAGWVAFLVAFWIWWLAPQHRAGWVGLIVNSALLLYLSLLPASFLITVNRLRRVNPALKMPRLRVAFVVTRAPSEPWPVARRTLAAMLGQRYPHPFDVWLCDEQPTEEIRGWCAANGVSLSTREDEPGYHRLDWPRRTRCKEGNLAWFYDTRGYESYDVVAQLDCDHVPTPTYLAEMVRPFADPAVGFVGAPSVCDANAAGSWAARSRLFREAFFHGAFQAGHNGGLAPVCIGSHYAVRTAALAEIGGVGPELAEDFSTSFLLTAAGWQGAFALEAAAGGDGPLTFAAMVTQEFQWSRSLQTLLYGMVPGHLRRLPWRLRVRYAHALLHYGSLAGATIAGLCLPPTAAVTGLDWVHVNYLEFLLRWGSVAVWPLAIALLLRRRGLMRPATAPVLSWEAWLGALSRWPYVAWGVTAATLARVRPRTITFKVTPKSRDGMEPLAPRLILPYAVIVLMMSGAALAGERTDQAAGYVFLCLLAGTTYAVVALAIALLHAHEVARATKVHFGHALRATAARPLMLGITATLPLTLALVSYPAYAIRAFAW
ncbi:glycosyltransferase [Mangrovihabitans endophyticus]|uniref:N-acetylglucosaminyltransferase n=1 Tax=Mangrovihabitans endophyticus TaxID=1751298 RepID=A0A8J3BY28_9ACTN|nr:glycosyltransferase [Mangrovihabitans endophyticus]GGK81300.1 N-acetylglucosaminyltransferase [Mangrovihabitans endophyticus]